MKFNKNDVVRIKDDVIGQYRFDTNLNETFTVVGQGYGSYVTCVGSQDCIHHSLRKDHIELAVELSAGDQPPPKRPLGYEVKPI